jgi:hypothetical protein
MSAALVTFGVPMILASGLIFAHGIHDVIRGLTLAVIVIGSRPSFGFRREAR